MTHREKRATISLLAHRRSATPLLRRDASISGQPMLPAANNRVATDTVIPRVVVKHPLMYVCILIFTDGSVGHCVDYLERRRTPALQEETPAQVKNQKTHLHTTTTQKHESRSRGAGGARDWSQVVSLRPEASRLRALGSAPNSSSTRGNKLAMSYPRARSSLGGAL